jgi:uncharacterized membrane protein
MRQLALGGLLLAAVVQADYYYAKLPNPMAIHFNGRGVPDGWSSPGEFFTLILLLEVVMVLAFLASPPLLSLFPTRWINFPNKHYWLAPPRRDATLRALGDNMLDFAIATQLFLIYTVGLTIQANLSEPVRLSEKLLWGLAIYLIGSIFWTVRFFLKFRLPKEA